VSEGTGFGSTPGLRVGGKIFAMLARGQLVAKLPKDRVDELVESGVGSRFDAGKGRPMKEWVSVPIRHQRRWTQLAEEALAFVIRRSKTAVSIP
jgi:TfoX/Sxy family transcriptional regulator of competence genes